MHVARWNSGRNRGSFIRVDLGQKLEFSTNDAVISLPDRAVGCAARMTASPSLSRVSCPGQLSCHKAPHTVNNTLSGSRGCQYFSSCQSDRI